MATYKDYLAECEAEGTTPLSMTDWRVERMHAAKGDPPEPVTANPTGPDPEDVVTIPTSKLEAMMARLDDLEHRVAVASSPRDDPPASVLPREPEPWGSNGNYSYYSDTAELELTIEPGHTKMSNGRLINVPDKSVKFSGNHFTTDSEEIRDWLEAQPEFNGRGGAKYPATVMRTELLQPGKAVRITDGPKTTTTTPTARYADRPTPLHAKV